MRMLRIFCGEGPIISWQSATVDRNTSAVVFYGSYGFIIKRSNCIQQLFIQVKSQKKFCNDNNSFVNQNKYGVSGFITVLRMRHNYGLLHRCRDNHQEKDFQ